MSLFRSVCHALRVGLLVMLVTALASVAQAETRLSMDAARNLTAQLLQHNRPQEALTLAEGILQGRPDDPAALILKTRALRDLGRMAEANQAAKQARTAATAEKDRFFSALVTAQTRASAGQNGIAQYWLRHAAQIAPDDHLKSLALRDFRQLRRATPWRLHLNLSAAPSNNVNGAPRSNEFTFGGLPFVNPSAVPLSGTRVAAEARFVYRIPVSARARISLGLSAGLERVRFDSGAQDKVPDVKERDFAQDRIGLSFGHEWLGADRGQLLQTRLGLTRRWYGGALLSDTTRIDLTYQHRIAEGWIGRLSLGLEDENRHDLALRDQQTGSLGAQLTRRLSHGSLSMSLTGARTDSQSRLVARDTLRAGLSYGLAKPIHGMMPRFGASWEAVNYDSAPYDAWTDPRKDRQWRLSADILLPDLDYMGFAPEIGLSWRDRRSNYSLYETRGTDLRLGLKSVF
ncbi:MAG: surface lipoprotein assembly modifier [Pelagimonas sp.]|jgi:hypothetical protein|nr:surface lipoprotein assembly modifier [Pelagimonas sp.]